MKKNLVIWDLDGVIADSEKIWLKNRQISLNQKFGLNWDFQTVIKYIGGMSDKTKQKVLADLGYNTDDAFWAEQTKKDLEIMQRDGLKKISGVENIIKKLPKYCIATGGAKNKTIIKLKIIGFWNKYFNDDNVFTADMVEYGKPNPDIFLLAAKKMGEKLKDCIIIEDSIVGITAAQKAKIDVIAFLGCDMYQNDNYISQVKELGIKNICFNMKEVEKILFS